jgi:hypothetical protein
VVGVWALSGSVSMLALFSPSSFGVRDITLSFLLGLLIPAGIGVIVALAIRVFITLLELLAAVSASTLSVK